MPHVFFVVINSAHNSMTFHHAKHNRNDAFPVHLLTFRSRCSARLRLCEYFGRASREPEFKELEQAMFCSQLTKIYIVKLSNRASRECKFEN